MRQGKNSTQPNVRWRGCAKLSILLIVASILMVVLFCSSCAASRKESSQTGTTASLAYADSLINELRSKEIVTVPQSQVTLRIPIDDLRRLPKGSEFRDKSGQASASVQYDQDTVFVFATCDSLQRMCFYYERTSRHYKEAYESLLALQQSELEEDPPDVVRIFLKGVLTGALLLIGIIIFIKLKTKLL